MKVRELINLLQKVDQDLEVYRGDDRQPVSVDAVSVRQIWVGEPWTVAVVE